MANKSNFTINFYEVLGVEPNASLKEIKTQYSKLVIKYHPDKVKDGYESAIFELIQRAYDTLKSEQKRQEYDFFIKNLEISKNNDHLSLKSNYDKFRDLDNTQPKNKDVSQVEFDKVFSDMDIKHGVNRSILDETIDTDTITNKLDDLLLQREQDEIEFSQNTIFRGGENFDLSKFNAAFDMYKNVSDKQVIKHSNVTPFNFDGNSGFSGIDVYDKVYDEDNCEGGNMFSNVNIGKVNKLDADRVKNVAHADYTFSHNNKLVTYEDDLKKRLSDREFETKQFDGMNYGDFNTEDKTFQFSHEIGITENLLDWDDNSEDLLEACKKLIELEKKSR
jgi:curved DNA-binding protein CbpA